MIRHSHIAAIVTDPRAPDNPVIACNAAFVRLTGYPDAEVIGRNCRFLAGSATEPEALARLREAIRERRPAMVELLNYRKDGSTFRNAVMIAPMFDDRGEIEFFLGSQVDVGAGPAAPVVLAVARVAALSARQRDVLVAMARGWSSKQIAHALGIAERTVKMHRAALIRALGLRTGVEAIRVAIEAGF
jgi:PAS domain S-box-containing protein